MQLIDASGASVDTQCLAHVYATGSRLTAETRALYQAFRDCYDLRTKYMINSRQRLEDNPINYDGQFNPKPDSTTCGHANVTESSKEQMSATNDEPRFKPWTIYPPPPQPHWSASNSL